MSKLEPTREDYERMAESYVMMDDIIADLIHNRLNIDIMKIYKGLELPPFMEIFTCDERYWGISGDEIVFYCIEKQYEGYDDYHYLATTEQYLPLSILWNYDGFLADQKILAKEQRARLRNLRKKAKEETLKLKRQDYDRMKKEMEKLEKELGL